VRKFLLQLMRHGNRSSFIIRILAGPQHLRTYQPVQGAGIHMREVQVCRQPPGNRALAGGCRAVNRYDYFFRSHRVSLNMNWLHYKPSFFLEHYRI
jgi:hypothetical protein